MKLWRRIRKWSLAIGFILSVFAITGMAEAGTFESPKGFFVLLMLFFYVFWFTAANIYRK